MEITDPGGRTLGLTWCTNLFPSGDLKELLALIRGSAARVKALLNLEAEMGLGLWLPASVASQLAQDPGALTALKDTLARGGFYLGTVNCFPMGRFHGSPVKQAVYLPDWSTEERLAYTLDAQAAAARLARPGSTVSLSTLPLGLAGQEASWVEACAGRLLRAAHRAAELEAAFGVELLLALEPEPGCFLERGEQAISWLASQGRRLAGSDARIWSRHIGLCLDACHMAVLGEQARGALLAAREFGVRVGKLQLASALELTPIGAAGLQALQAYVEPIYCHQSAWLTQEGRLVRAFADLEQALAASRAGLPEEAAILRAHYHVPLFWEGEGLLRGTAPQLLPGLLAASTLLPEVLEVETYTWSILPGRPGGPDLANGVAEELRWALDRMPGSVLGEGPLTGR